VLDLVALSVGAGAGAVATRALRHLREHRGEPAGVADLLNWGFLVDDGPPAVVLQKDGSLLAGWRYRGPDFSAATTEEIDALSAHVNDALLPFTDNWMFHVDAIRRSAATYRADCFPDPICQLIDDERRETHQAFRRRVGGQFETSYYFVATYPPPGDAIARVAQFFVQSENRHARRDRDSSRAWENLLAKYRGALSGLESRLSPRLAFRALRADDLITHLHESLTGLSHHLRTPPHGAYLDSVLSDQELVGGFEPTIGRDSIRIVAIQGYPDFSRAGDVDALNSLGFGFRWSTRIVPVGTREAAGLIRRHQLQWFKKRKGAASWAQELVSNGRARPANSDDAVWQDQDARAMAEDAAAAAASNAHGDVRFCYTTQTAVIMNEDADAAAQSAVELLTTLADAGFTGRVETVNALEAYLGSLPGHGYPNLRRPLMSTRNVADLLPLTSVWPGLSHNPSPFFPANSPPLLWARTAGATPFRLNIHDSDVGHTLIFGPTGAGKSVLLGLLAAQFRRYPGAQVFAFDVGYSMWTLATAAGALHQDLAAGRPDALRLQPLAMIDEAAERAWAAEWIETLVGLQGLTITPQLRARIDRGLELLARNERAHRTLTELSVQVQHEALAAALRPFTVAGHYGELLDASSDDLRPADFEVFELKHLLALDDRVAVPVLLYLFRCVERRLGTRPTLIEIDEAWIALMHSLFGPRIHQWLLTLRKQNAAVVLATQSPAQFEQLPFRHTVLDSCPTKIYLPNPDAATPAQIGLYRELGLNAREIESIARAVPKRHYYFKSPRGSRLFELGLGPVALAFLAGQSGATMDETRRAVGSLIDRDELWPATWLESLGLDQWAARLRSATGPVLDAETEALRSHVPARTMAQSSVNGGAYERTTGSDSSRAAQ
jgi:type IV secretion system protein VirB4